MTKSPQEQLAEVLKGVPLFSTLNGKQLKTVAAGGKELSYAPGQHIVDEGTVGVGFFLVMDGKVRVRKGTKTLAELKAGDFFGEMSLFDSEPRSATVEAISETKCLAISAWSFTGMVKSNPDIAIRLLKELAARLRLSNKALGE